MNPVSMSVESKNSTPVQVSLTRTPKEVNSWQPALIFAHVRGDFNTIELHTTITINLLRDGISVIGFPQTREKNLPFVPVLRSPGWYIVGIPGLPAKTKKGVVFTWKVESSVSYRLLVDGFEVASDSYVVQEREFEGRLTPLIMASVYDVLQDPEILLETYGLGPKGWKIGALEAQKFLIVAVDDKEVEDVDFEYSISSGSWQETSLTRDDLASPIEDLINSLDETIQSVNVFPNFPEVLPKIRKFIKIFNAEVPGQHAGSYVKFRAKATDIDGNSTSSPSGFYFVVNEASDTRILIVDPHIKLWLLEENLEQLLDSLKRNSDYQVPSDIIGNMALVTKIAEIMENYDVVPFHHWEMLGKDYDLYVAWPDRRIVELLEEFEPKVIILSNLRLGLNITEELGPWNWDLGDITASDGKTVFSHMKEYVKERHAGLIATHGTLSDWVVWTENPATKYRVGARGHIGNTFTDIDPLDEKTIAALLGLSELALWEFARDSFATTLYADPATLPFGIIVGSLPLQVPRVPFNKPMKTTPEARGHLILDGIPEEFEVTIPSVYNEFGFKAFTQVGWQLACPQALANTAWWKSNEARSAASRIIEKMRNLMENVTSGVISSSDASRIHDSLEWGLNGLYRSLISANTTEGTFNITLNIPLLKKPLNLSMNVDYQKLLQRLPVKLIALSENCLAGIVTHDKYWDPNGYRATYFSFEVEAADGDIAETLLVNAVEWGLKWQYKDVTDLLGGIVRMPKELTTRFNEAFAGLSGIPTIHKGLILNEEGYTTIKLLANTSEMLHILTAHPTSNEVKAKVLEGPAKIVNITKVTEWLTLVTVEATEAGKVTLGFRAGFRAGSQSALNPAYVSVKEEIVAPPAVAKLSYIVIVIAIVILAIAALLIKRRR